jgi:hypothetical protein
MKFYQLHRHIDHGSSAGYSWFTSRAEAEEAKRADDAEDPTETPGTIECIEIEPTKAGILRALRRFAGHPDNG